MNLSIGVLLDDAGYPVVLDAVTSAWKSLTMDQVSPYAPIAGDRSYLKAIVSRYWDHPVSDFIGCASPGASGALALSLRNFLERGDTVVTLDPYWTPYLILAQENGNLLESVPYPLGTTILMAEDLYILGQRLLQKQGRFMLWLNDPCHNPSGEHLSDANRDALLAVLGRLARLGPVTLILDIAYAEYAVDQTQVKKILEAYETFAQHSEVLVGATLSISKPLTLYGARCGALVFPWCDRNEIQASLTSSCRGMFSNAPRAPQALSQKIYHEPQLLESLKKEQSLWAQRLSHRALHLMRRLDEHNIEHSHFVGGFFIVLPRVRPNEWSVKLKSHDAYLVPLDHSLRVGICALRPSDVDRLVEALVATYT